MGLRSYLAKRIIYTIILVIFVLIVNFTIFELMPGDPATMFAPPQRVEPAQKEAILRHWGFKDPFHIRLLKYMYNMLTFQMGESFMTRRPVADELMFYLPNTLVLMGLSSILAIVAGVVMGVIAAHRRGGLFDNLSVTSSLIMFSLPTFWMAMIFLLVFSLNLGWFPSGKAFPVEWAIYGFPPPLFSINLGGFVLTMPGLEEILVRLHHLFLPLLILSLFQFGGFLLLTRATTLEALTEDYVNTARAKGLKERTVLFKHVLRNASLPIITASALQFGFMIGGAIITETVFSLPGIGQWTWGAIQTKNYTVLQAIFYITALCVIIANFIADLLYGVLDPRIRYG